MFEILQDNLFCPNPPPEKEKNLCKIRVDKKMLRSIIISIQIVRRRIVCKQTIVKVR